MVNKKGKLCPDRVSELGGRDSSTLIAPAVNGVAARNKEWAVRAENASSNAKIAKSGLV